MSSPSKGAALVLFHVLGPVGVHLNGKSINVGATRVRSLLGILLLGANTAIPVETLRDRLQGDAPCSKKAVQTYVSRLRTAFKLADVPAKVVHVDGSYRINVDRGKIDYHRFRQLVDSARQARISGDHSAAIDLLEQAIALWHGPPLADLTTSWAEDHRQALVRHDLLPAYYDLFDAELARGNASRVRTELRQLIDDHDTDERFAAQWMRAVAATDGPGQLPSYFRAFTERVRRKADAEPSQYLVDVYESLTHQSAPRPPEDDQRRSVVPRQLPRPTPYFAGRHDTLAKLDEILLSDGPAPTVAISGAPGIGKTELVTYWGTTRRRHFPDGELYYNLNGFGPGPPTSPGTVLAFFLGALGLSMEHLPQTLDERIALFRHTIADRRILIVLDNVRKSDHVRSLLSATGNCPVVITSQQQLTGITHRDGAHRITLRLLSDDESIELLNRRISDDRAHTEPQAVQALAALCSGLALGLRIVAEHVAGAPNASIEEIVATLRLRRRSLLDAGNFGDDDRTTLRAVYTCAYEVRTPDVGRLYRLLGLYPSPQFTTDAVAALAGLTIDDTEEKLMSLVGAHLIDRLSADRFRLHDLLHLFTVDLASQEPIPARNAALNRLFDWYLGTTVNAIHRVSPHLPMVSPLAPTTDIVPQRFRGRDDALAWCTAERSTIPAVARLAAEHGFHGHVWRLLGEFNDILSRVNDPQDLFEAQHLALRSAELDGSIEGQAGHLNELGVNYFNLRRYDEAERCLRRAYELLADTDHVDLRTTSLHNIATVYRDRGEHRKAVDLYTECLNTFREAGYELGQAQAWYHIGETHLRMDQHEPASEYLHLALRKYEELDDPRGQGETLSALGRLSLERNDYLGAIGYCQQALNFNRLAMDTRTIAESLVALARACRGFGAHNDAAVSADEAAGIYRGIGDIAGLAQALEELGNARSGLDEVAAAAEAWHACLDILDVTDPIAARVRDSLHGLNVAERVMPVPRSGRAQCSTRRGTAG